MADRTFTPIDHYVGADWPTTLEHRQEVELDVVRAITSDKDGSLLDIGCGDGFFLAELDAAAGLTTRGWKLSGVDVAPEAIELATARPYHFELVNAEGGLPFADNSLDVVTAGEVIEHVYDPDALLEEIHRVLRPGGSAVITTPNPQAWYNRALFLMGTQPLFFETSTRSTMVGAGWVAKLKRGTEPVGHIRLFNRRALIDLTEAAGFQVAELRGAVFQSLPAPVRKVDMLFTRRASLASGFIIRGVKV